MASRYWVGGTGNWDATTTHWSATSGGAGGASVPTSADDVFFNSLSNATGYTVTLTATANCKSISVSGPSTGIVTVAGTTALNCYGSFTLAASGVTWTHSGAKNFVATTTGWTIRTNGVSIAGALAFSGVGGGWTLGSALTTSGTCTVTAGTLSLSSYTLTCSGFTSASGTRTLAFGTGNITATGSGIACSISSAGLTITGTPVINFTYSGAAARTISSILSISLNITAGTGTIAGTFEAFNVNFTGYTGAFSANTASIYGDLIFDAGMTVAANANVLTLNSLKTSKTLDTKGVVIDRPVTLNGGGGTWTLASNLNVGSPISLRTLTLTAGTLATSGYRVTCGAFSSTGSTTRSLSLGSSLIDCYGNWTVSGTGVTITPGTSTITMYPVTASSTFAGGGLTYATLTANVGPSFSLIITGSNTFDSLLVSASTAYLTLAAGSTQTVTNFDLSGGSGGSYAYLNSTSAGGTATLSKASGTITQDWLYMQDSTATGGATWNAGSNSVNSGNNSGWIFGAPPVTVNANFFMFFG